MRSLGAALVGVASLFSLVAHAEEGVDLEDPCAVYASVLAPGLTSERAREDTFDVLQSNAPAACRRRVAAGAAPALVERLVAPTDNGAEHAVLLTCVLQVPGRAAAVGTWVVEPNAMVSDRAREICLTSLAEWPDGQAIFAKAVGRAHRGPGGVSEVDRAFVGAARHSAAVRRAAPRVLAAAAEDQAHGYDALLAVACSAEEPRAQSLERLCKQGPREATWDARAGSDRTLLHVGVGLALYAGALAGAYATRDTAGGRAIPTVGGALSGAILGVLPALVIEAESFAVPINDPALGKRLAVLWAVGALVGGTAGGYLAWRFSGDADARLVATGVTWALPCVAVARLPF
jgi:hypothetical protein